MRKLTAFNFITLDGYYKGPQDDTSWHHHEDKEAHQFAIDRLQLKNTLLFGRLTYEMMAGYWPSPVAASNDEVMAKGMNEADKIVFSQTLKKISWNNTTVIRDNILAEVKKMKQMPGNDLTVLGSGSIITQFATAGLIDEYQFMLDPVAIGNGTPIFKNVGKILNLKLTGTKIFKSGIVLLSYLALQTEPC